jgi:hypothetical protein
MIFRIKNIILHLSFVHIFKNIVPLFMILIFAFVCFFNQKSQSVTVDEFHHFPSGIYNIRTFDWRMNNESPPLIKCFPALSTIITSPKIDLNSFENSPNTWKMGYSFMYLNKEEYRSIYEYGRCIIILFGCLLGWLIYIWAKELYGYQGALFALALYIFNPNILAHSTLITIDIGATCIIFLSIYCFWKYLKNRNRNYIILAGVALGFAQLAKFTALLLYPIFLVIIILAAFQNSSVSKKEDIALKKSRSIYYLWEYSLIVVISIVIINSGYFFVDSFKPISEYHFTSDLLKNISTFLYNNIPLPLPYDYIKGFDTQLTISGGGIPFYVSYLMGEHSLSGWWYYYPISLIVKNPEPFLIIFLLALVAWIVNKKERPDNVTILCIWLPVIAYFIYFSFFAHIPIGIRYILPVFPLLFLACGYLFNEYMFAQKSIKVMLSILIAMYIFIAVAVFPQYLSYFNLTSGGSQNGYRWLIDSNLDWGQSLPALKKFMDKNNIEKIKLGYFGRVDPTIYGITYSLAENELSEGLHAISINYLVGKPYYLLREETRELLLVDMNYYQKYRKLKPSAIIDNSIYIFDIKNIKTSLYE